ncbi:MAG: ATP-binding cassette domain-containing protein [Anaerolineales bacterium]|nr:ATP-binding cassette domain-containing protein [Anaerolineales bacterium]
MIKATNLKKSYGELEAVKGISFEIARGEVFGLLGPNGAGKSTTIAMLTGLMKPTDGTVKVAGDELSSKANHLKRKIGFIPQELALYPTLSAYDNLLFFGRIYGLHGKILRSRVDEVLEMVSLKDRAKDQIETYSGGMKRRINIAAGLLHQPEVLFLDEPTVGVDPQSRNAIFESIEGLNQQGLTILYTTHYMEEAERLCHRVAIIDHGQIIALDAPQSMIHSLGGGLVRVGLMNGKLPAFHTKILELSSVKDAQTIESELMVQAHNTRNALVDMLEVANQMDATITSLEIHEPNLETVFLNLTGRSLRN